MHIPKVSVVIPVYKVEQYLRRCVDSVLAQTLSDLEIILVDDGSPDHCPEICDEYASKHENIRVIHKPNGGLASARNAGMKVATGQYLFFLDSDDWLDADGLEQLYLCAEKYQVDFVRYRAIRSGWPGMEPHAACMVEPVRELHEGYYNRDTILKEVYPRLMATPQLTMGAVVGACGSLYRMDFLRQKKSSSAKIWYSVRGWFEQPEAFTLSIPPVSTIIFTIRILFPSLSGQAGGSPVRA